MHRSRTLVLALLLLAGCSAPAPTPPVETPPPAEAPAPLVQAVAPLYEPPPPKDARLLVPDPTGRYIADVDRRLRVVDYAGQIVSAPEIPGAPVQQVLWAPRGDRLIATTGKPTASPERVEEPRHWLVDLDSGQVRELPGLPQDVFLFWALDEASLYVLDNWNRPPQKGEYGERIQRYNLATGELTLLLDRQPRLTRVRELRSGDLLVGQYAGGGHSFSYRLPAGSDKLVKAAPFHVRLSPDERWAAAGSLFTSPNLAIADVTTGEVTDYRPTSPWPWPNGDTTRPLWMTGPVFDEQNRWLLYTIGPNGEFPAQLRFYDRTKAEPDRVVEQATGAWLPGPGLTALVLRRSGETVTPWRYDVATGAMISQVGPEAPAAGGAPGCQPVWDLEVAANGATAGLVTCSEKHYTFWFLDLTGSGATRGEPYDLPIRLVSLSADGKSAAIVVHDPAGMRLDFVPLAAK